MPDSATQCWVLTRTDRLWHCQIGDCPPKYGQMARCGQQLPPSIDMLMYASQLPNLGVRHQLCPACSAAETGGNG